MSRHSILGAGFAFAACLAPFAASAEEHCLAGWAYMGSNPDGAIAECNRQLEQERKPGVRSQLLVYRAGAFEAKKDDVRALADFDEAIKLDPDNASAFSYRASFYRYRKKDLARALANYSAAVLLNPSYANLAARGDIYAEMDRLEAATKDYDAAIKAEPKSVLLYVARGDLWRRRGEWDKALADYEKGLTVDPTFSNAIKARSSAHAMLALGPALAIGSEAVPEARFKRASAKKIGVYTTVELWSLDGKPHHCALASSYDEPAWAIGRSASGYALTLASGKWGLDTQKSYALNVQASQVSQAATAKAVDPITLGILLKPDPAFLAAWAAAYRLEVKSPRSTVNVDGSGSSNLQAIDACWRDASNATAADPFAAP